MSSTKCDSKQSQKSKISETLANGSHTADSNDAGSSPAPPSINGAEIEVNEQIKAKNSKGAQNASATSISPSGNDLDSPAKKSVLNQQTEINSHSNDRANQQNGNESPINDEAETADEAGEEDEAGLPEEEAIVNGDSDGNQDQGDIEEDDSAKNDISSEKKAEAGQGDTAAGAEGEQASGTLINNNGPRNDPSNKKKIKEICKRTGYILNITPGQRKYGGPPPDCDMKTAPGIGHEIFLGRLPKDVFEDELVPLLEPCGKIWDLRIMIDPLTGYNRGYAFVTFCSKEDAQKAVDKLDGHEIRQGKPIKANISVPNVRLFIGNIPKSKSKEEIMDEFSKLSPGLIEVIVYSSPEDRKKNRGFCFLEYESHKAASAAKRKLSSGRIKVWGCDILVDWADPQEEPDDDTMSKVKVLYVRNLTSDINEEGLKSMFEEHGAIERVKKIKDYAFVHFDDRDSALKAMDALNGHAINGVSMEVSLAKPPSDRKKKEEILRNRGRRIMQMMQTRNPLVPRVPQLLPVPLPTMGAAPPAPHWATQQAAAVAAAAQWVQQPGPWVATAPPPPPPPPSHQLVSMPAMKNSRGRNQQTSNANTAHNRSSSGRSSKKQNLGANRTRNGNIPRGMGINNGHPQHQNVIVNHRNRQGPMANSGPPLMAAMPPPPMPGPNGPQFFSPLPPAAAARFARPGQHPQFGWMAPMW